MRWKPHVTVAAVLERDGRFLLVEEDIGGRRVYNQPAGHLEPGESLCEAVVREVAEETGRVFVPHHLVGLYRWHADSTFLRFCFCGEYSEMDGKPSDPLIIANRWLNRSDIAALSGSLRSPMVLACVDDYLAQKRFPLDLFRDID